VQAVGLESTADCEDDVAICRALYLQHRILAMDQCNFWSNRKLLILKASMCRYIGEISPMAKCWTVGLLIDLRRSLAKATLIDPKRADARFKC